MAANLSRTRYLAILLSVSALAFPAAAQEAVSTGEGTLWTCWYDLRQTVQCELTRLAAAKAASDSNVSNTPPVVASLRCEPERYVARRVAIPTHTVTNDWERVRLLAEAAVCGTRRDCGVEFFTSPSEMALALSTR